MFQRPVGRRKGLPKGNLTSQYFANFYLKWTGPRNTKDCYIDIC